jgi:uncharacterized protein (DUF1697 family)
MKTYIALFRGINVGGNNMLPMKELAALLQSLGCQNVKTYIRSGNAVFGHKSPGISALTIKISAAIHKSHGFKPNVFVLEAADLEKAIASNPFPEAEPDPKSLHVFFLASTPEHPDVKTLEKVRANSERFKLSGRCFYLHAPDGVGRSKLAAGAERLLGVPATGRNWRTVREIMAMVGESYS